MIASYRKNDAIVFDHQVSSGWEKWYLLMSDEHFDSVHCDRKLLKKHHDQAVERNATILKFGDIFDCMGGKYDPRSGKGDIRPEYQHANYFQSIVKDAAGFYSQYADNIRLITDGNHEGTVLQKHEYSLLDELSERISPNVLRGKYSGFIRFKFNRGNERSSIIMYYTHGSGGSSPVTKGVINTARRQDMFHADIFVSGHSHAEYDLPRMQTRLNEQCRIEAKRVHHYSLGTYQDSHMKGGWVDVKGFGAPSMGARWLRFYYENEKIKFQSMLAD